VDGANNLATSGDFTFTTAAADTTPPVISAVAAGSVTKARATISWTTDEASDSQVEYGTTTAYGSSTTLYTADGHEPQSGHLGAGAQHAVPLPREEQDAANTWPPRPTSTFTTTNAAPLNSLALSGTGYAEAPNATELNITGDWTLEAWFRDETPGGYNHEVSYIAMKGNTDNTRRRPSCSASPGTASSLASGRAGPTTNMTASLVGVSANAWHHAAAVFVASNASGHHLSRRRAGRAGRPRRSDHDGQRPAGGDRGATAAARRPGGASSTTVRIWNVARTGAQIAANYQAELASPPTGLVGNWKFNDGSGTTATDSTTTPQNANLVGGATWSTDNPSLARRAMGSTAAERHVDVRSTARVTRPRDGALEAEATFPIVLFSNSVVMGGMEEHVIQLARGLKARGFPVP
jgi:hypothetical protein